MKRLKRLEGYARSGCSVAVRRFLGEDVFIRIMGEGRSLSCA